MLYKYYFYGFIWTALSACTLPHAASGVNSTTTDSNAIVVISKVELDSPFDSQNEQTRHTMIIGESAILNKMAIAFGGKYQPIKQVGYPNIKEWKNYIKADLGKPFMVKLPRQETFINGGMITLDIASQSRLWFPGGFYFTPPKNSQAIYIGTLRYTRNVFNTITKVEIVDEFSETISNLQLSPNQKQNIQKSLLRRVK